MDEQKISSKSIFCIVAIIVSGCLWGCMGLYVRFLDKIGFSSFQICEIRTILTAILMFIFLLFYDRSLLKINFKDCWCFIGSGLLSIQFFNFCYFTTIQEMQLSFACIMLYTAPIFVMLLSAVLFKEKITAKKTGCLVLAFAGCVFVSISGNTGGSFSLRGILIGLCSGFGYALYSIFSRYALKRGYKTFTIVLWTFIFAAFGGAFLTDFRTIFKTMFYSGNIFIEQAASSGLSEIPFSWWVFFFCVIYSITTTVLPYILYTSGLTRVENSKASVLAFSEPLTATLLGIFVYKEIPGVLTISGIVLILGALVLLNMQSKEKDSQL